MTPIFFLIVFAAGLVMALTRHPVFGLYTYIFTFYMTPAHAWWADEVPGLRYLLIAGVVTLVAVVTKGLDKSRRSWLRYPAAQIMVALVVWMWIQNLWAVAPEKHYDGCIDFTKHAIVFFLIYHLIDTQERMVQFLMGHIVGCMWWGYLALDAGSGRLEDIGGPVGGANELGVHVTTALIVGGLMWMFTHGRTRTLIFVAMPLVANTIILTVSRGAFLGFFVGGLVAGVFTPSGHRRRYLWTTILAAILISILAHDDLKVRFTETWEGLTSESTELDKSALSRKEVFRGGWPSVGTIRWGPDIAAPGH